MKEVEYFIEKEQEYNQNHKEQDIYYDEEAGGIMFREYPDGFLQKSNFQEIHSS